MRVYEQINQYIWPITFKGLSWVLFQVYSLSAWALLIACLQEHFWCKDMKEEEEEEEGGKWFVSCYWSCGDFDLRSAETTRALMCDTEVPDRLFFVSEIAVFTGWWNLNFKKIKNKKIKRKKVWKHCEKSHEQECCRINYSFPINFM